MTTKPKLPSPSEPLVLKDGTINPVWYRYLEELTRKLTALIT
jgi:hypothetical protein